MKRKKRNSEEAAVDLTPMIDVVFQLIIFFVVTVNLDQQSVMEDIKLPPSEYSREPKSKDPRQVTIQVNKKGRYFIGTARYRLRDLKRVLANTMRTSGGDPDSLPILIRGDGEAAHKYIRRVMDACSEVGLYKIRIAGMKQEAEQPRVP